MSVQPQDSTRLDGFVRVRRLCKSGAAAAIRHAAGVSLAELADEVGVSPPTIWRWETGEHSPHGDRALAYLAVLDRMAGLA